MLAYLLPGRELVHHTALPLLTIVNVFEAKTRYSGSRVERVLLPVRLALHRGSLEIANLMFEKTATLVYLLRIKHPGTAS